LGFCRQKSVSARHDALAQFCGKQLGEEKNNNVQKKIPLTLFIYKVTRTKTGNVTMQHRPITCVNKTTIKTLPCRYSALPVYAVLSESVPVARQFHFSMEASADSINDLTYEARL